MLAAPIQYIGAKWCGAPIIVVVALYCRENL